MTTKISTYKSKEKGLTNQLEAIRAELARKRLQYAKELQSEALAQNIAGLQVRETGILQALELAAADVKAEQARMQGKEAKGAAKDADRLRDEIEIARQKILADFNGLRSSTAANLGKQEELNRLLTIAGLEAETDTVNTRMCGYLAGWLARMANDIQMLQPAPSASEVKERREKQQKENERRAAELRSRPGYLAHQARQ